MQIQHSFNLVSTLLANTPPYQPTPLSFQANGTTDHPDSRLTHIDDLQITQILSGALNQINLFESDHPLSPTSSPNLPPVEVREDGRFTTYKNAYGLQITQMKMEDGITYNTLNDEGFSVIIKHNDDKRDTLAFSDMNDNIRKNSQIPNVYFHVRGQNQSKMYFNDQHQLVIDLSNGESLVFDAKDGKTLISGAFDIYFNPQESGQNFNVSYSGNKSLRSRITKGDRIRW